MIRWLIVLIGIGFLSFVSFAQVALAQSTEIATITQQQLRQGEETAQKALKAIEKGNYLQAEVYWTQLIEQFPNNPAVWSNRGNTRIAQNRLDDAIADFNRSIEIAPQYPDPYLNRGIAYESKKLRQKALADYNQVLAINPDDAVAYNNRGNAKAGQKLWQEALTDYQKAVEIAPNFALARVNTALMNYQLGNRLEAIRELRNLVRKYPLFSDPRAALTAALWVEGLQGEAESNWVATVGLDHRYQELNWVKYNRRWPPEMVQALEKFLTLS
jgi:tetratricopeptide (TPR) repeat protein